MNFDFSIESSINNIHNTNTKRFFKEVYQTFANGNYRSSTVMLYSVLICDLIYKLRDLRDIYNDEKANKILGEIEALQVKKPNSPEWETKLIEFIRDRTSLLEPSDIVAIEFLQKFRHLSAHPILNNSDLLYSPNKETVQALIRNILDGVLTNQPFFSNRIFDTMLTDLAEVREKITEVESLKQYVISRYIKRLKDTEFRKVFRSLWKVVFITDDINSITNREINYEVLKIFITHDKAVCIDILSNEAIYFSNINKDESVSRLIKLIAIFPEFYISLETALKQLIISKITTEDEYRFIAWFLKPTIKEHILALDKDNFNNITDKSFKVIKFVCMQNCCEKELNDFAIEYFGASYSFDATLNRYSNIIVNCYESFTLQQTKRILEVSQNNYQVYQRIGMKYKLQNIAEKYEGEIDKSLYQKIFTI
jgi:hypothetical protein